MLRAAQLLAMALANFLRRRFHISILTFSKSDFNKITALL